MSSSYLKSEIVDFDVFRWGVYEVNPKAEPPRPDYLAELERMSSVKMTYNSVTREEEPKPHFWRSRLGVS